MTMRARSLPSRVSLLALCAALLGCVGSGAPAPRPAAATPVAPASARPSAVSTNTRATAAPLADGAGEAALSPADRALLDDVEERTFRYFWELADPHTGLIPDRWPTKSFASVSATGFGLTAYVIGVERGWVTREQARARVLHTLRFLWEAPQGPAKSGVAGDHGFFYHFLVPETGMRFETVELSTIDTTFLLAGALVCGHYFDRDDADEREIRRLAEALYARVDWTFAQPRPPRVGMGWKPEEGFIEADWHGYDEGMLLYLLALGSPTHPIDAAAWDAWTSSYKWGTLEGYEHVLFPPLFGHQYSHLWVDFRGIRDAFVRAHGIDYFENSRRATLAQRAWAIRNPRGWAGLGADVWGVSACDGPADVELSVRPQGSERSETRRFWTYAGRGVGPGFPVDDGTLAPTAAGGSLPFAPAEAIAALRTMKERYGEPLYGQYGFRDAFNPTFQFDVPVHHGHVVPGVGWFDHDWLGIDEGPIVAMIENHRSGLVWRLMRQDQHLRRGLARAGFTGGWLDREASPR
jgi:hypothetical protein